MIEEQKIIPITARELVDKVQEYREKGFRLIQINATQLASDIEINYSFGKDYSFESLRVTLVSKEEGLPSVSGVYWSAFLYENEMHDLYGIRIFGIALDYKGKFYRMSKKYPFFNPPKPEDSKGAKP